MHNNLFKRKFLKIIGKYSNKLMRNMTVAPIFFTMNAEKGRSLLQIQ